MEFRIWYGEDIESISQKEINMWFDIYNNDLFEDRGYDITFMPVEEVEELYKRLKSEYVEYLMSLQEDPAFLFYVILENDYDMYVSHARVITRDDLYYIEGLETHRDMYYKGYATSVIYKVCEIALQDNIKEVYANIYYLNEPSIKTFLKCGFQVISDPENKRVTMKKRLV
jgi:RimJ/RimL family protein N-acetyltransferase